MHAVQTDVSQADQVDELAKQVLGRYGAVHVLCNNAGIGAWIKQNTERVNLKISA
jgi:NAD(P)-dependent dehydrogenase (short-subunit alcohol dehydrogenase family)